LKSKPSKHREWPGVYLSEYFTGLYIFTFQKNLHFIVATVRNSDRNKNMILQARGKKRLRRPFTRRKISSCGIGIERANVCSSVGDEEQIDSSKIRLWNPLELNAGRLYVKEI
jgi:hypothetical protein